MTRRARGDEGAYAILYGLLIVVLIGMTSVVVDLGMLRSDKRDARTAADNGALAGTALLGTGPYDPYDARQQVRTYAWASLNMGVPGGDPCTGLGTTSVVSCPANATTVSETSNGVTLRITWPIPSTSSALLNPDGLSPGGSRAYDSTYDGTDQCTRLGVQISRSRSLGLAGIFGVSGSSSTGYSVARVTPVPSTGQILAGLNILDPTVCQSLLVSGQGKIIVNRALDQSRGTIAVESDGSGCPNNASKYVIDLGSNASAQVCVSGPNQIPDSSGSCDGLGTIESHALDGSYASKAYAGSTGSPTANLKPKPIAENGTQSWLPVTSKYGCKTLPGCTSTPSYIWDLYTDDNGTWPPTTVYAGQGTYTGANYGSFQTLSDNSAIPGGLGTFKCVQGNSAGSNYYVPPGNWLIDCKDTSQPGFQVSQTAVFGGGHLVFRGGIKINGGSCFSVNTPLSATTTPALPATASSLLCPSTQSTSTEEATTSAPPVRDAIMFIRGSEGFVQGSSSTTILLPQTMVVQANGGTLSLGAGSGTLLWTAPGAGTKTAGKTLLDTQCTSDAADVTTCHDSHFAKTVYWNEAALFGNNSPTVNGQGGLTIVGTFFTPRSRFLFAGQGSYVATSAQFWVDMLELSGQGGLGMTPDPAVSFYRLDYGVALIR